MTEPEALAWRVARLEAQQEKLERELDALRAEAEAREKGYWRSGVIFLGGLVATLIGIIWANLGTIIPNR